MMRSLLRNLKEIVLKAKELPFAMKKKNHEVAYIDEDDNLRVDYGDSPFSMSARDLSLSGKT